MITKRQTPMFNLDDLQVGYLREDPPLGDMNNFKIGDPPLGDLSKIGCGPPFGNPDLLQAEDIRLGDLSQVE